MRSIVSTLLSLGFLASLATSTAVIPLRAKTPAPPSAPAALKVGDLAPDFKLRYFDGTALKQVSLSDYRGKKNVVLAFYVFAFTGG